MNPLRIEIETALAAAGCQPLHRFGQHFMVDERALAAISGAAGTRTVEIGPGTGILTRRLLDRGGRVLAVEIDHGLAAWLRTALVPRGLELVEGDCLAAKDRLHPAIEAFAAEGPWTLCANLPYDVAIPAILNACALPLPPTAIMVTVQWECAVRLGSKPGDEGWGASAAVLRACGSARILRRLAPGCFLPPPRVDSAILAVTPERALPSGFPVWCRQLFAYRRKVLVRALRDAGVVRETAEAACAAVGLDPARRVENLDSPELIALHAALREVPAA
jgi:16S rRNA (adenine1518-N6/adenine1519-N6)-dimethyltransferase